MRVTRLGAAIAVAALVAAPALAASPNPAGSLTLANGQGGSGQTDDNGSTAPHKTHTGTIVLAGLAVAAVVGGAIALGSSDHHHGSTPASN